MTTRKNDRRFAQDPHYLRNEHLTADRRVNDRRGPVDAIREKLAQQLQEQRELNAELESALSSAAYALDWHIRQGHGAGMDAKILAEARAVLAKVKHD